MHERHKGKHAIREAAVLDLLRLLRDLVGWQEMLDYIVTLPRTSHSIRSFGSSEAWRSPSSATRPARQASCSS